MIAMADGLRVFIHSLLAFVGLVVLARIFGQKLTSLIGIAFAAMAGVASLQIGVPWTVWLIGTLTWAALGLLTQWLCIQSATFAGWVGKKPTKVVQGGKILEDNLHKSQVAVSQLLSMMRQKNAFSVADVEMGVIEPDGQLSVLLKSESQPVTPKSLNIPVENQAAPVTVVMDGTVQPAALGALGEDRSWIFDELRRRGVTDNQGLVDESQVVLAQVDGSRNVTFDFVDDAGTPPVTSSPSRPATLATLKKVQAELETYCLETQNPNAKALYQVCAQAVQQIVSQTASHLNVT